MSQEHRSELREDCNLIWAAMWFIQSAVPRTESHHLYIYKTPSSSNRLRFRSPLVPHTYPLGFRSNLENETHTLLIFDRI